MSISINKVILQGNLGADPDISNDKKRITFSLATSRYAGKDDNNKAKYKTEWHRCVIFRPSLVEMVDKLIGNRIQKGSNCVVSGYIQYRTLPAIQEKNLSERDVCEIVVEEMQSEFPKEKSESSPYNKSYNSQSSYSKSNVDDSDGGDDIPF